MKRKTILSKLEDYFNKNSKEKINNDWKETYERFKDKNGDVSISDFIDFHLNNIKKL